MILYNPKYLNCFKTRYLEFVSSLDDHSSGKKNLTKATEAVKEKGRSYRGLNFFSPKDLLVLEGISRGEYMTFGMYGKDIRRHLKDISSSAMSGFFKRLRLPIVYNPDVK